MDPVLSWLLDASDPGVRAKALVDLVGRAPTDREVVDARERSRKEGSVARLLEGITFPDDGHALYLPKYLTTWHRVMALGEMGAPAEDPRLSRALDAILAFYVKPDGGMGRRASHLCTTGNLCRAMLLLGVDHPALDRGLEWLIGQQMHDGGWHCWPEKHTDGTIDAWEAMGAFAALPEKDRPREVVAKGMEFLFAQGLGLASVAHSRDLAATAVAAQGYAPWGRIHFPRHYFYDALVGLDIATAIAPRDTRLAPAIAWLEGKRGADGRWRLDAHHPDIEDPSYTMPDPVTPLVVEEIGTPSKWATLYALRALRRAGRA